MPRDWDRIRPDVQRLYNEEDKPLKEVIASIEKAHGFRARSRLKDWGLLKVQKDSDSELISSGQPSSAPLQLSGGSRASNWHIDSPRAIMPHVPLNDLGANDMTPTTRNFWQHLSLSAFPSNPENELNNTVGPHSTAPSLLEAAPLFADEGQTRPYPAIRNNSESEARPQLTWAASPSVRDQTTYEPVRYCIANQPTAMMQHLTNPGSDPMSSADMCQTSLHLAVLNRTPLKDVIKACSPANFRDEEGRTPLNLLLTTFPLDESCDNTIRLLIGAGADVNIADNMGHTCFHLLLDREYRSTKGLIYKMIIFFLENTADTSICDRHGRSPLEIFLARSQGAWASSTATDFPGSESSNAHACLYKFMKNIADINVRAPSGELLTHEYLQNISTTPMFQRKKMLLLLATNAAMDTRGSNGNCFKHEMFKLLSEPGFGKYVGHALQIVMKRGQDPDVRHFCDKPLISFLTDNMLCSNFPNSATQHFDYSGLSRSVMNSLGVSGLGESSGGV